MNTENRLRIAITDSGVGGLSVCAALEQRLREAPAAMPLEVFYLNAALEDDYAYNSMATRQEKLETFGNFLQAAFDDYRPDRLFIACNTLSVLFEDPYYDAFRQRPIRGIVGTGAEQLVRAHRQHPHAGIIVFATETTIAENAYGARLERHGVPASQYVQQACPGLPDAISNDASGGQARALLERYLPAALEQFSEPPASVLAFLGCTHYGYQADGFRAGLLKRVERVSVINPNAAAAAKIATGLAGGADSGLAPVRFRVVSRYAIPASPLRSLAQYLDVAAPATLKALQNFHHRPDFFQGGRT